jgi:tripartite-type tricarboxylate transporter receptor subunit TctC
MLRPIVIACLLAVPTASSAPAQDAVYPARPINIIVPFAPGGSSDILTRVLEPVLVRDLGQPLVILNRPGAAGNIGMEAVAKSPPDGHTMVLGNSLNFVRNYLEFKDLKFSDKDFAPVSLIGETPLALVVHPSLPVNSLKELIDHARANPNKISYGAQGTRSLDIHMIRNAEKISMNEIPYPGGSGQLMKDLVGGHIQLTAATTSSVISHIRSGELKAIALMSAARDASLPDVPTVAEAGYPQFQSALWFGFAVPAGTPQPIIARLHRAVVAAVSNPEVMAHFARLAVQPKPSAAPEDFRRFIEMELGRWRKVADAIESTGK